MRLISSDDGGSAAGGRVSPVSPGSSTAFSGRTHSVAVPCGRPPGMVNARPEADSNRRSPVTRPSMKLHLPMKPATNRPLIEILGRPELLEPALVHHADAVGDRHRLLLVVRDEHRRDARLALQIADLLAHLGSQLRVERRERFVEQQHVGLDGHRPGERHALLLTSRQGARRPVGHRIELHPARRLATRRALRSASHERTRSPNSMFFATDRCGNSAYPWNTMPTLRLCTGTLVTSRAPNDTRPEVGAMKPAIIRKVVVLPQPLGPSSASSSPSRMSSDTSSTATTSA